MYRGEYGCGEAACVTGQERIGAWDCTDASRLWGQYAGRPRVGDPSASVLEESLAMLEEKLSKERLPP